MRLNVESLRARADRAYAAKAPWYGPIQEAWRYAAPGMDPYHQAIGHNVVNPGTDPTVYDGTLGRASLRLATRMSAEVFPPGHNWATMYPGGDFAPLAPTEGVADRALDATQARLFNAIHSSGFYLAVNEMCLDGAISGTGVMKVSYSKDAGGGLVFEAVRQSEVAFEVGPRGNTIAVFRKLSLTRDEILTLWPDVKVPPREKGEDEGTQEFLVLDACYLDVLTGAWHYDVVLEEESGNRRLVQEDLAVNPWVVWRFYHVSQEPQGRSPAMFATPDARTLNHAVEVQLKAASLRSAGIYTVEDDSVFNPKAVRFVPGALIPVSRNPGTPGQGPTIAPLPLSGDVNLNNLVISQFQEAINKTMLVESLPPMTGPVRSATEIAERTREAMLAIGGPYLRLFEEVARPVLRVSMYHLANAGKLPELSDVQGVEAGGTNQPLMLDGTDIALTFKSPLHEAQQIMDAEGILRWAAMSQQAAGPAAYQGGAKTEDIPEELAFLLGVDAKLVRDSQERAAAAQAAMGQQGLAQGQPAELPL